MAQSMRLPAFFIASVIWRIASPTTSGSANCFARSETNWKKLLADWTSFHEQRGSFVISCRLLNLRMWLGNRK
jgi:hypothetical protein